ncbi:response regulator [Puniceicoccaceae bacterium K14]|nr:response regulator [Puniceicoccaceae bacterium K14]
MMNRATGRLTALYLKWKGSLSLREKLVYLISGVSIVVVFISMAASFAIEFYFFRNRLVDEYTATARMVGSNLEAAIIFNDARDSREVLGKLDRYVNVESAGLYVEDSRLLATYIKEGAQLDRAVLEPDVDTLINYNRIVVNEAIYDETGTPMGRIVLEANLGEVWAYLSARIGIFAILLLFVFAFTLLLAWRLGRVVALPIVELTQTANRIAKNHDFSARPVSTTDDETGQLVDAFNEMMTQINARDDVIRSSEKRFRDYFDLSVVGAAILDIEFKWIEANDRILEMLKCSIESIEGVSLWSLLPKGGVGLTLEQFNKKVEGSGDRIANREFWLRRFDGLMIYVLISMRYVPSTKYQSEHIVMMAQDITNRKRYEEGILKAKEEAEASSKAKDEFLSVISHELRTPLNPIIGYVDLLIEERDVQKDPKRLRLIKKSAEHLLDLIDDVLHYSRIERGVISLNKEAVDYQGVCNGIVELMTQNANSSDLRISCQHTVAFDEAKLCDIAIDGVKFQQVVLNLVSNALKFTNTGFVELRTGLNKEADGSSSLKVEIEDTGIGIDESDFDRVLKPFSQIDSSLTRRHGGMGLGLAISKKIVEAFGGKILFKSQKGVGSLFYFEIPVDLVEKKANQEILGSKKRENVGSKPQHPILLVEDEPINLELAKSLLSRISQDVVCAKDGVEAVEKASKGEFSLIIMDVRMPRMDGLEATREIRKLESNGKRVPIVAVSAHATERDKRKCFDAGMDDYMPKPLSIEKLNNLVKDWF